MIRSTSQREHERQYDQCNDYSDLDTGQPEFEFPEESDAEVIDAHNHYQEHGDKDSWINSLARYPVLQHQCSRCQLVRRHNDVFEPIARPECQLIKPFRLVMVSKAHV